jgi:outer membrane receptor protein involved in Fe transport
VYSFGSGIITMKPLHRILLLSAATWFAGAAFAADNAAAAPVTLAPVRVTGDLWAAPLERIAASVTVFDDAALRAGAVRHFGDLVDQIPNLTWTGGTSRPRYFQIRGVGENSQYEGETPDAAVRFVVDDLDFTGLGSLAGTFDVSQVEVLRGPQAGAFGANAAGGLIRLVTNAPTPFFTGQIEATLGEAALREGGFAVGGPLLSSNPRELMFRLAVHQHNSDGFRHNVTRNQDTNARDEWSDRLRVTWNPSADWRWEGAFLHSELRNGFDEFALNNNGRLTYSDQPGRDQQRSLAASVRGVYSGGKDVRFTTVTSGAWVKSRYSYDDDWTAASYQGFSDLKRFRDVASQELRFDSALARGAAGWIDRWTLGAYFSRTNEDSAYTDEDPWDRRGLKTTYRGDNAAVFGQVAHDFSAATRLIVGLRTEHVVVDGSGVKSRWRKARNTFDPLVSFQPSFEDTLVGGKVTLEYALSPQVLGFASVTRGYRGGGVNVDARISPPADPLTYGTEYLWSYEAGLRGSLLEQRLKGELTAFYLDRRHTQVRDAAGFGGSYRFFTTNGRGASVYGLEASGSFALSRDWSLHGSLSEMESDLDRFVLTNGNVGGGRRLANTPRHGGTAEVRYRTADGWFSNFGWVGRASQFDSNNNDARRRAFGIFNATLGRTVGAWTVTLWGRNLGDAFYDKRVFFFGNEDPDYIEKRYVSRADPRQFGATVSYRF